MRDSNIYSEVIIEHSRSNHNEHHLSTANIIVEGKNPSCGDEIKLELQVENGTIVDASFTGVGCAISKASTSIMIDLLRGQTIEKARKLIDLFYSMIKRESLDESELELLEDAVALKNISNMPARVKCATMSWHTLEDSIKDK